MKKNTTLTFLYGLLLLIAACDKDDNPPYPDPPPVVTESDTLDVGWSQQKVTGYSLADVFFQDSLVGYVGGDSVYKTNNGGATWTKIQDSTNVINLFVTTDGGLHVINAIGTVYKKYTNWAQNSTTTMLGTNGRGSDLYFINSNNGFLITDKGVLKTTNGGIKWELVANTGLQMQSYSGLSFLDSTTGWIFSGEKIFRTNGTITSWITCNMPVSQIGVISGIHVVSPTIIYAATFAGKILKSIDQGQSFTEVANLTTPPNNHFADIYFLDALNGYVCYDNRIYQTKNGGLNWTKVVAMARSQIIELHFTDANHGWACTTDGKVLKYSR